MTARGDDVLLLPTPPPEGLEVELVDEGGLKGYRASGREPIAARIRFREGEGLALKLFFLFGTVMFGGFAILGLWLVTTGHSPFLFLAHGVFFTLLAYVTVATFVNRVEIRVRPEGLVEVRSTPLPVTRRQTFDYRFLDDVLVADAPFGRLQIMGKRAGVVVPLMPPLRRTSESRWLAEALRAWFARRERGGD